MRLHCLGTAGFHPNQSRHTSCYFLPESGVLLDAGTGLFRLAPLIQTNEIDVLLSHAHLDHICGLTFLLDVFYQRPVKKLRIWGEAAKLEAIQTHLFSELVFPVPLEAEWNPIDELQEFRAGNAAVRWRPQDHPGGSVAYRLDWDQEEQTKSLVYMTDTTGDVSDEGIEWCSNADMLMHECYFDDSMAEWAKKTGHSWTSRVAEITSRSKPKKLLMTHVNPLIGATPIKRPGSEGNVKADWEPGKLPEEFDPQCEIIRKKVEAEVLLAADELVVEF